MRIIIPMAGMGKRMRPHTLVTPKPLIEFAGKPMVHHIVEELAKTCHEPIEEIAFIIGRFGEQAEKSLIAVAEKLGAKGSIYYQDEPLGTAHAVLCAKESLKGKVIVGFADTLFKGNFELNESMDSVIWVQQVADPRAFGVVKLNSENLITDFVEKPQEFVSDLAIIGIYYFKDGENLRNELQYIVDNDLKEKGEYQLTNALENMQRKGLKFAPGKVSEWLDCGNKNATVETHTRWLQLNPETNTTGAGFHAENALVIQPCYIGNNVHISNAVVGPHVSVADGSKISSCVITNSIIQKNTHLQNCVIDNAMIGSHAEIHIAKQSFSLGDFSTVKSE